MLALEPHSGLVISIPSKPRLVVGGDNTLVPATALVIITSPLHVRPEAFFRDFDPRPGAGYRYVLPNNAVATPPDAWRQPSWEPPKTHCCKAREAASQGGALIPGVPNFATFEANTLRFVVIAHQTVCTWHSLVCTMRVL